MEQLKTGSKKWKGTYLGETLNGLACGEGVWIRLDGYITITGTWMNNR